MATPGAYGAVVPMPTRRPGSAVLADIYGAGWGTQTTSAGGEGATREAAAAATGTAPLAVSIGPDFLARPAGAVVVGLVALLVLSWFDR